MTFFFLVLKHCYRMLKLAYSLPWTLLGASMSSLSKMVFANWQHINDSCDYHKAQSYASVCILQNEMSFSTASCPADCCCLNKNGGDDDFPSQNRRKDQSHPKVS